MTSFSNLPIPKLFEDRPATSEETAVAKQLAADQCLRWSSCGKTTRARLIEQARRAIKTLDETRAADYASEGPDSKPIEALILRAYRKCWRRLAGAGA